MASQWYGDNTSVDLSSMANMVVNQDDSFLNNGLFGHQQNNPIKDFNLKETLDLASIDYLNVLSPGDESGYSSVGQVSPINRNVWSPAQLAPTSPESVEQTSNLMDSGLEGSIISSMNALNNYGTDMYNNSTFDNQFYSIQSTPTPTPQMQYQPNLNNSTYMSDNSYNISNDPYRQNVNLSYTSESQNDISYDSDFLTMTPDRCPSTSTASCYLGPSPPPPCVSPYTDNLNGVEASTFIVPQSVMIPQQPVVRPEMSQEEQKEVRVSSGKIFPSFLLKNLFLSYFQK